MCTATSACGQLAIIGSRRAPPGSIKYFDRREGVRRRAELSHRWSYDVPGNAQPLATELTVRVEPAEAEGDREADDFGNSLDLAPAIASSGAPPAAEAREALCAGIADAWRRGGLEGHLRRGSSVIIPPIFSFVWRIPIVATDESDE